MLLGYGAKVGLGNMRVKAENRMVTNQKTTKESKYTKDYNVKNKSIAKLQELAFLILYYQRRYC